MRKLFLMSAVLGLMLVSVDASASEDGIEGDVCARDDALGNAAWDNGWCGDEAPAPLYAELEDTLVEPWAEAGEMSSASGSTVSEDGLLLTDSCVTQGDGSPQNPYRIVCTNYGKVGPDLRYVVGVSALDHDLIIACRSEDAGSTWTLDGSEAIGTITRLYVYGSDESAETMGIQKYTGSYTTDCSFQDFPNQFTTIINLDGRGYEDAVFGSQYADTIRGEYIMGYEGNDTSTLTIYDYVGTLTYYYAHGGPGNDIMYGTNSSSWLDYMVGGEGNDTLWGNAGMDYIYGYTGDDTIWGGNGEDRLYGGDNNDTIYGQGSRDYMYGGNGNDTLNGVSGETTAAYDLIYGENGNDTLSDQLAVAGVCDGGDPASWPGDACTCNPVVETNCES